MTAGWLDYRRHRARSLLGKGSGLGLSNLFLVFYFFNLRQIPECTRQAHFQKKRRRGVRIILAHSEKKILIEIPGLQ